eukprot:CAMPEP_0178420126 /NCGR_PEP_ID=MMETSP0689_2-20121128/25969_1 /TAXON_ID=160604 /ORGANISM="Amphidinium massartii, Strain CS-259" /LENGTH=180 /DNA_ID=CAMNT_0020041593 /DNA_START=37 /DNA_END=579 /DNA_ORIENTATION=-
MATIKGVDATLVKRGSVLGLFNLMFVLIAIFELSVLSFLANLGVLVVLCGAAFNFSTGEKPAVRDDGPLSKERTDQIDKAAEWFKEFAKKTVVKVEEVVLWADSAQSTKAIIGLFVLRFIAPWIGLQTIVFLGVNAWLLMMWGAEEVAMKHLGPHLEKMNKLKDQALAKVPRYDDLAKGK